jgi:hypothetical protein
MNIPGSEAGSGVGYGSKSGSVIQRYEFQMSRIRYAGFNVLLDPSHGT